MVAVKFACIMLLLLFTTRLHSDAAANLSPVSNGKGLLMHGDFAAMHKKRNGGRKMAVDSAMNLEKMEVKVAPGDGKCGKVSNLKCKDGAKEVDEAGFVAFSADYRAPRHHPPKNN